MATLEPLVCPDCGNDELSRDASAMLRLSGRVYPGIGFEEHSEERIDVERDYDTLTCRDCGSEHDPDDLVTAEAYAEDGDEDDDLCDALRAEPYAPCGCERHAITAEQYDEMEATRNDV